MRLKDEVGIRKEEGEKGRRKKEELRNRIRESRNEGSRGGDRIGDE
jgi:hypothetical protein